MKGAYSLSFVCISKFLDNQSIFVQYLLGQRFVLYISLWYDWVRTLNRETWEVNVLDALFVESVFSSVVNIGDKFFVTKIDGRIH